MYLENISSPQDVKNLSVEELEILCHEVRDTIVQVTRENGGHLASNLGIVELSVALLYVFDTKDDKIIYDVGHQSYTHKILTGRREEFENLRKVGGVSGFPKTKESFHDAFNTGHASTSISVGYGMAKARDLLSENKKIISVIGDGSLSGGLAFEGINNLVDYKGQFLIVLNDNGMAISKNVGGLSKYLSGVRSNKNARKVKKGIDKFVSALPNGGNMRVKLKSAKKKFFTKFSNGRFFESMGLDYYGAIDGHNIKEIISFLEGVKDINNPCVLHVKTTKGKGYSDAEASPEYFHGVSKNFVGKQKDFSEVAGEAVLALAKEDKKIVSITASMIDGVGLSSFERELPNRLFDVGICESHAVTFSAGLSAGGILPYFMVYSSFLQRGFDQIYHDVVLPQLPVKFLIDRCGIVGADGETHQGVLDLNFLISCGGIDIICPKDDIELTRAIEASKDVKKPLAIRYPRGYSFDFSACGELQNSQANSKQTGEKSKCGNFEYGTWEYLERGNVGVAVVAVGAAMCENAVLAYRNSNVKFSIVNARFVVPMDESFLNSIAEENVIVLSDSNTNGGFASVVEGYYSKNKIKKNVIKMEISCLLDAGDTKYQQKQAGLSDEDIIEMVNKYASR